MKRKMIGIITFLQDADFEDFLIKTLVSEGISEVHLDYRATTEEALREFLEGQEDIESRRILIQDREFDSIATEKILMKFNSLTRLSFDSTNLAAPAEIEGIVHRTLRSFQSITPLKRAPRNKRNSIVITGTTGAPGISTIGLNLASEIARSRSIQLVDAHPNRKDLGFLLGAKRSSERVQLSGNLSISEHQSSDDTQLQIIDAGSIPNLSQAFSDRRREVSDYIELLETASQIVFLMTPENNHMFELEAMIASIDAQRFRARPFFAMNQLGNSRREHSVYKRFRARVGAHSSTALPFDRPSLDRAKAAYSPLLDVAPRSKLRRSISELALLLIE